MRQDTLFAFATMAPTFILFMILLISLHLQVNSQHEQAILLSLKQHWGNPISLNSWNSTSSPCDWPHVDCIDDTVTGLHLGRQNISGTIPSPICQLKDLVSIDLFDNNISGQIPACLCNCSSLQILDLSANVLSGTIPGELFLMESLRRLSLNGNRLFGTIPTTIENASSLEYLDLSDNHLNGSIPDGISYPYKIEHLDLSRNSFSGEIPMGLFSIGRLQSLSLGYNSLSGPLPAPLQSSILQNLNLNHNRLNGTIPKTLVNVFFEQNVSLDLSDNQLSGDIVENLEIFLNLINSISVLRLRNNNFLGKIPYEYVNYYFHEVSLNLSNSNLCSDEENEGLPSCPSSLCSYDRFRGYLRCYSPKHYEFIIILLGVAAAGFVGYAILYYLVRKYWLTMRRIILANCKKIWNSGCSRIILANCKKIWNSGCSKKEEEEWKMISFQRLKFDTTDILSSLTDENLIGNGGSGKVYRVFINQTGTAVAVKSISNSNISDHRRDKEFLAEIQTLGTIRHYNIVKLLCYISGNNLKLLVYEYFENKSLDRWLHGNSSVTKLDWPTRLNIAIGAAQGLCYMHHHCSQPIIHRDIKSSNILLDSEFNAKIADFGLAKLLNGRGDTETASAVAGTFGYIAPEYAYTVKVNTKSDVYSFGVVLLELTTGRKAVTRGDHMNLGEWARLQYSDTSATFDALDDEIKESNYLDQIIAVFRLGVVCTATSPPNRPSMKDCLNILQNSSNNCSSSSTMT